MAVKPKTNLLKLTKKDFVINPSSGKVLVSHDKLASLIQSSLNKAKIDESASGVDVTVTVGVKF